MSARSIVSTADAPAPFDGFAQGVRAGPFVFLSGQLPIDFADGLPPDACVTPGLPFYTVPMKLQTASMLKNTAAILAAAGASAQDTVCIWSYMTDGTQAPYGREERSRYFRSACASTAVVVKGLPVTGAQIGMDLICLAGDTPYRPEPVTTDRAPIPPAGRYPQAVKAGPYIFTAGQIPTDFVHTIAPVAQPDANFPLFGRNIKRQAAYILSNIGAVLEAAGSSLDHVVKASVFLKDAADFQGLDEVWRDFFPRNPPARTIVPSETLFPGVLLEIQTIAVTADGPVRKEVVHTDRAPRPIIHQAQAVKAGEILFVSGVMATDYKSAVAPAARVNPAFPNHASAIGRQTAFVLDTIEAILEAAGSSLDKLAALQAFLSDPADFAMFQDTARARLPAGAPWPTMVATSELIVPQCRVAIDATAAV